MSEAYVGGNSPSAADGSRVLLSKILQVLLLILASQGGFVTVADVDPTSNPTNVNAVWINRLLGKVFAAKPDLSGWTTIIG